MGKDRVYLETTTGILGFVGMWDNDMGLWNTVKGYLVLILISMSTEAIFAYLIWQIYDEDSHFTDYIETLVGGNALLSVIYVSICLMINKEEIKSVIESLRTFEKYLPEDDLQAAEDSVKFYTKSFILYGIIGNTCYDILPLFASKDCDAHRSQRSIEYGIACRVIVKYVLPFKHDFSPLNELVIVEQMSTAVIGTTLLMSVTMLVGGILTHLSVNIQHLQKMIGNVSNLNGASLQKHVNKCVRYHSDILNVIDKTNEAFSVMMLVHVTWTSFIISVLGFQIVADTTLWNTSRFTLHLWGWLMILFVVCFYGQILINKESSSHVADAVYEVVWYDKPPTIRRDLVLILLRSQRPSVLKVAGISIMSLSTFLGILYSAYSYFTLLLKFISVD